MTTSPYMRWAKLESGRARFNLATSGVMDSTLAELPVEINELQINGPGGYGYAPLLQQLAAKTGAPAECIVPSIGTSMANFVAFSAIIARGDQVLVECPTYHPMLQVVEWLGADVRRFHRLSDNDFAIDLDELRQAITPQTKLIVLANLHNPSSCLTSENDLREIGALAAGFGALVLVDEVYLETLWEGRWRSSFHLGDNFVTTSSLTKAYGLSGLRCGWIVAPPHLVPKLWHVIDMTYGIPAHPAERLSVIALDHLPAIRARARALVERNRLIINEFLGSVGDHLRCARSLHGTTVFPEICGREAAQFCERLHDEYKTTVVPGTFFELPNHIRIGMGGPTDVLEQGLAQIAAALAA